LLLIVLAKFIARFVSDQRWQTWTWWLLLFSGGWGLLVSLFFNQKYVAYELIAPDAFVFSVLYGTPHVILGFALFLIWIGYMLDTLCREYAAPRQWMAWRRTDCESRTVRGHGACGNFRRLSSCVDDSTPQGSLAGAFVALSCIGAGLYSVSGLRFRASLPGCVVQQMNHHLFDCRLCAHRVGCGPLYPHPGLSKGRASIYSSSPG
jgi:hypothetical protein